MSTVYRWDGKIKNGWGNGVCLSIFYFKFVDRGKRNCKSSFIRQTSLLTGLHKL